VLLSRSVKTSLDHLPEQKRVQIATIADVIRSRTTVEMLILFGSYARGNWVEDLANGYFSDYDLMAVVETPELAKDLSLWSDITDEIRPHAGRIPVSLVVHDVRQLNREIRIGQYFYADVANEGILLFDSRRFQLAKPKALTELERYELGLHNFDYWFQSANEFWRGAGYYAARGLGPHAAFSLHQAAERYFHSVLLVFTGYKPKSHDIEALANQTAPFHEALEGALPRTEAKDEHHFDLLKRAYIEARYSRAYRVTSAELEAMRNMVADLAQRVRSACADKLRALSPNAEVPTLAAVPAISDVIDLPDLPDLSDPNSVEAWRDAITQMSYDRGRQEGEQQGLARGRDEGRHEGLRDGIEQGLDRGRREGRDEGRQEERARAVLEVLQRRGISLTDEQTRRIRDCRDEAALTRWWEQAWTILSADELT
jgi:predicted nucleotidyltransferase/HEPN domain-containing protein